MEHFTGKEKQFSSVDKMIADEEQQIKKKPVKKLPCSSISIQENPVTQMRCVPGLAGGVGPQLFNSHQHRTAISVRERWPLPKEFWESLGLTQVDLQKMSEHNKNHEREQPHRFWDKTASDTITICRRYGLLTMSWYSPLINTIQVRDLELEAPEQHILETIKYILGHLWRDSVLPLWPRLLPAHLSELPLPQLLPEDQLLPRELCGGDVLPGEGVHGEGGDGVHVAAGDALQPHDVRLGVVRRVAMETLVRGALGDVRFGVASSTRCRRVKERCLLL